jgi:hypothetical protein
MDEPIFSLAITQESARNAHARGAGRNDHNMNWHAARVPVWQAEWDRCEDSRVRGNRTTGKLQQEVT